MNVSRVFILRPVATWLAAIALVLTGLASLLLGRWAQAGDVAPALWLGEAGRVLIWAGVVFSLVSAAGYISALLKATAPTAR